MIHKVSSGEHVRRSWETTDDRSHTQRSLALSLCCFENNNSRTAQTLTQQTPLTPPCPGSEAILGAGVCVCTWVVSWPDSWSRFAPCCSAGSVELWWPVSNTLYPPHPHSSPPAAVEHTWHHSQSTERQKTIQHCSHPPFFIIITCVTDVCLRSAGSCHTQPLTVKDLLISAHKSPRKNSEKRFRGIWARAQSHVTSDGSYTLKYRPTWDQGHTDARTNSPLKSQSNADSGRRGSGVTVVTHTAPLL